MWKYHQSSSPWKEMTEALSVDEWWQNTKWKNTPSAAFCGSDKVSISFVLTTKTVITLALMYWWNTLKGEGEVCVKIKE